MTQKRARNSHSKRVISVRATEVLLYVEIICLANGRVGNINNINLFCYDPEIHTSVI